MNETPRAMRLAALIIALSLFVAASAVIAPVHAGDDDHAEREHHDDRERRDEIGHAVERGQAKPLNEILRIVREAQPGDILGVEVETKNDAWVYEVRVADSSGRLLEVYVDARTGQILKTKEK